MCPFCYIGKRKFEQALEKFDQADKVEVKWKSFQLNPGMKTEPGKNINQYLAENKGWTLDYARKANNYVTSMAAEVGLNYNMDKAVVANSLDAHRLIQLAARKGKDGEAEEALFKAYFTEGKNIADKNVLAELGNGIGLEESEVRKMLDSNEYVQEVRADQELAQEIGVQGVPFFVIDEKYAVSGAQSPEIFLQALQKSYEESKIENLNGGICTTDGICS